MDLPPISHIKFPTRKRSDDSISSLSSPIESSNTPPVPIKNESILKTCIKCISISTSIIPYLIIKNITSGIFIAINNNFFKKIDESNKEQVIHNFKKARHNRQENLTTDEPFNYEVLADIETHIKSCLEFVRLQEINVSLDQNQQLEKWFIKDNLMQIYFRLSNISQKKPSNYYIITKQITTMIEHMTTALNSFQIDPKKSTIQSDIIDTASCVLQELKTIKDTLHPTEKEFYEVDMRTNYYWDKTLKNGKNIFKELTAMKSNIMKNNNNQEEFNKQFMDYCNQEQKQQTTEQDICYSPITF